MPTTTSKTLSPEQFRDELEALLGLAVDYAALEDRIERKAAELEQADWLMEMGGRYINAVGSEVRGALEDAKGEHGHSDFTGLQLCQSIQDAIDVLTFAIERDDRKKKVDDAS